MPFRLPFYEQRLSGFSVYLDFLRAHGLVRSDLGFAAQLYTVSARFIGFFTIGPWMPDRLQLADEEIANLIGKSIHRTLETGREVLPEEQRELAASRSPGRKIWWSVFFRWAMNCWLFYRTAAYDLPGFPISPGSPFYRM